MKVIEIYRMSDSGEERRHCLSAIGKAKDSRLLANAMDYILNSGEVRRGLLRGRGRSVCLLYVRDTSAPVLSIGVTVCCV